MRINLLRVIMNLPIVLILSILIGCSTTPSGYEQSASKSPGTFIVNGISCLTNKEYTKAIEIFNKGLEAHPLYCDFYILRGLGYLEIEDNNKAIIDFTKAIEISPKNTSRYNKRHGNKHVSVDAGNIHAILKVEHYAYSYIYRGHVYSKIGQYDKAISDFIESIKIAPYGYAYNGLSWILSTCPDANFRNGSNAVQLAKKAVESDPRNANFWDTYAAAYAEIGSFEEAVKMQEKATSLLTDKKLYLSVFNEHLEYYKNNKPYRETLPQKNKQPWLTQ
jgi:tetratricopeptide (TPR) repeat protein